MPVATLAISCAIQIGDKTAVELHVERDDASWRWELASDGQTLDAGLAATKLAAQFAAQDALERRLKRAGLNDGSFSGYRWN